MIGKRGASITGEGAIIGMLVRNSLDRPVLDGTRPDCEVRPQTCVDSRRRQDSCCPTRLIRHAVDYVAAIGQGQLRDPTGGPIECAVEVTAARMIVASAIKQTTRKSADNQRIIKHIARCDLDKGTKMGLPESALSTTVRKPTDPPGR